MLFHAILAYISTSVYSMINTVGHYHAINCWIWVKFGFISVRKCIFVMVHSLLVIAKGGIFPGGTKVEA